MRRRVLVTLTLAAALSGCATAQEPAAPAPPGTDPTATTAPTPETMPTAVPAESPAVSDDEHEVEEYPELDVQPWEETAGDALATAASAVAVYLDPASLTWWTDLTALLSPDAERVYATVDPTVIPAGEVIGDPVTVQTDAGGLLATVRVPTSVGDIDVLLTRATADVGGWEVEQINPAPAP